MRLIEGLLNHQYVIDKMHLEIKEKNNFHRLRCTEGSRLKIIKKDKGYPFLIEMEGTLIAFSREVAALIEVIPYV